VTEYREGDACMVFSKHGNAVKCFDYTPEALEQEAREMRASVTINDSPFVTSTSAEVEPSEERSQ
jgi:hypothetical protein